MSTWHTIYGLVVSFKIGLDLLGKVEFNKHVSTRPIQFSFTSIKHAGSSTFPVCFFFHNTCAQYFKDL